MITTVQCSICSQLNNKHRVVVTDFRLHHTCSIMILWLHSLSGVIRLTLQPTRIQHSHNKDHRRMRLRENVYRSSITDVKRRYTKHCNVNKMADTSGLGPSKFITLLTH